MNIFCNNYHHYGINLSIINMLSLAIICFVVYMLKHFYARKGSMSFHFQHFFGRWYVTARLAKITRILNVLHWVTLLARGPCKLSHMNGDKIGADDWLVKAIITELFCPVSFNYYQVKDFFSVFSQKMTHF